MDKNIYLIEMEWVCSSKDKTFDAIPTQDVHFPEYRRFIKKLPFPNDSLSGWTVLIQTIAFIGDNRTIAYMRYLACDDVPNGTKVGDCLEIWRSPFELSSKATIIGIVTDNKLKEELMKNG